jgi:hypothetical protein
MKKHKKHKKDKQGKHDKNRKKHLVKSANRIKRRQSVKHDTNRGSSQQSTKDKELVLGMVGTDSYKQLKKKFRVAQRLKRKGLMFDVSANIDPSLFSQLGTTKPYFILIDAAWARAKRSVQQFLKTKHDTTSVYRIFGDADYACFLATNKEGADEFERQLTEFVDKSVQGGDALRKAWSLKNDIRVWTLTRALVLGGHKLKEYRGDIPADRSIIARLQVTALTTLTKESSKLTEKLEDDACIQCYSPRYDSLKLGRLRCFVLICDMNEGQVDKLISNPDILKCTIELYEVLWAKEIPRADTQSGYYQKATRALAVVEVSSIDEYRKWEDAVQGAALDSNVFPFLVLATESDVPMTIGDFHTFDLMCKKYSTGTGTKITLGSAVYLTSEVSMIVPIQLLNSHGLICGAPQTGKSTATRIWVQELVKCGVKVHLVVNEKYQSWIKETFGDRVTTIEPKDICKYSSLADISGDVSLFIPPDLAKDKPTQLTGPLLSLVQNLPERGEDRSGRRQVNHFVLIDEAHEAFGEVGAQVKLISVLNNAANRGVVIFCVSQAPNDPWLTPASGTASAQDIASKLENKVFFRLRDGELIAAERYLMSSKDVSIYGKLDDALLKLPLGSAFVSFVNEEGVKLPPIQLKVNLAK